MRYSVGESEGSVCNNGPRTDLYYTLNNWNTGESHFTCNYTNILYKRSQQILRAAMASLIKDTYIHDNPSLLCVSKHRVETQMENMSLRACQVRKILCNLLIHQDTGIFGTVGPNLLASEALKPKWCLLVIHRHMLWTSCSKRLWAIQFFVRFSDLNNF